MSEDRKRAHKVPEYDPRDDGDHSRFVLDEPDDVHSDYMRIVVDQRCGGGRRVMRKPPRP